MALAVALFFVAVFAGLVVTVLLLRRRNERLRVQLGQKESESAAQAVSLKRYEAIVDVEREVVRLRGQAESLQTDLSTLERSQQEARTTLAALNLEVGRLSIDAYVQDFGLYEPKYQFPDSPAYKRELDKVYEQQKQLIKDDRAARCGTSWTVEGSQARGRKMVEQQLKLMLHAFNGECDALISKVRYDNRTRIEERMEKLFEKLNKLGAEKQCAITQEFLLLKRKELYLTHEYADKKQQEAEEQRMIREQMREEEKAQRELERAQIEAEREAQRYQSALEKARREAEQAQGAKLGKLQGEIERLSQLLVDANARRERAVSQAQLTRAGYVYVISNVGSFGEHVYKIGMTRRLDPMDRVHELGDASVPFAFDVHAMIYSEDAPKLESLLHRSFDRHRVNLINARKEFFRVSIQEIHDFVGKNHAGEFRLTLLAEAAEYRKSESMRSETKQKAAPVTSAPV